MPAPLRLFFDYNSPYCYIAWTQLHRLAERHGRDVEPVPFFLGGLLHALGRSPALDVPGRREYVMKDCARLARMVGVPFRPPAEHPFNALLPLRVSSLPMAPAARRTLIDRLFAAVWGAGEAITGRDAVVAIAGADLVAAAEAPENKARLKAQTDEAQALRVFGVPTIFVDDEPFFGYDSFQHIDRFLGGVP
jgi:2-hydroxychromene-2-carboxylate isomerase